MNHLFCSWGFELIKRNIFRSARCRWFEPGLSRVFHDIWLLGICLEILFSSASNIPNIPNSSKSFNTTVQPQIVPIYFKCSVHWRPSLGMPIAGGLAFPSWAEDIWTYEISLAMGAIHKMAPVGVCGALLHTGPCWVYGWLREAEKNSPSESYFLLLLLEYA